MTILNVHILFPLHYDDVFFIYFLYESGIIGLLETL